MNNYKEYLVSIGLSPGHNGRNHNTMSNHVNDFKVWLEKRGLDIETATYKDLMDHVGYLQKKGKGVHRINHFLRSVGHYYDYKELPNIAQTTRMRGVPKTQPQGLLSEEELENIYGSYESKPSTSIYYHSDKIILGMIIYQALDMQEFMQIELDNVGLEKGLLYIKSGKQKRERYVPLKANQVLSLDRYIRETRPQLVKEESQKLFNPQADNYSLLHWQFKQLSKKVKAQIEEKLEIQLHKLGQLRQSRIAIWVKEEGLRKAQYLAGFRNVSSAERYQKADLSDLKEQVQIYHPLS